MTFYRLIFGTLLCLCIGTTNGENLGIVVKVNQIDLPYFTREGNFEKLIENVNVKELVGQYVLEDAPRGLILLAYSGKKHWFRAIHFDITGGAKIVCPNMLVANNSDTKTPVTHNMDGDCIPATK